MFCSAAEFRRGAALLILFSLQSASLVAGEPPREPMLRIEAGSHTSAIPYNGIATSGRITVTAAADKTARVWDTASGKLLNVLRPPVAPGHEGTLVSVALSPNTRFVAIGGQTGYTWDNRDSVYVFDRFSGQIVVRLSGLPNTIYSLAWSQDGVWLAVGLTGGGVRLYETQTWRLASGDPNYFGAVSSMAFLPNNQFIAASHDGILSLYTIDRGSLNRIADRDFGRGAQLLEARPSPDGSRIAIIHMAAGENFLTILRTSGLEGEIGNLAVPFRGQRLPDGKPVKKIQTVVNAIGWLSDGKKLLASLSSLPGHHLWAWDTSTWESRELAELTIRMTSIPSTPSLDSVLGAEDGSLFGVRQFMREKPLQRFEVQPFVRNYGAVSIHSRHSLKVSEDYAKDLCIERTYWAFEGNNSRSCFSAERREIGNLIEHLQEPSYFYRGKDLSGANDIKIGASPFSIGRLIEPTINSRPIELGPQEHILAAHVFKNGSGVVTGTTANKIRLFGPAGEPLRVIETDGNPVSVNGITDGKIVLAAISNGIIRWFNTSNGKEFLSLFIAVRQVGRIRHTKSGNEWTEWVPEYSWVLWTPSGYYDASVGGEELIGWHVNRGAHQAADFYPVSRFRDKYYRPDIVAKVLDTLDEAEAIRQANADAGRTVPQQVTDTLPPAISILSPTEGAELAAGNAALRMAIRTPAGAPLTHLSVRVNGKVVQVAEGKNFQIEPAEGVAREIDVPLDAGPNQISVLASNRHGASVPKILNVNARAPRPPAGAPSKPVLRLLAVGVSQYRNPDHNLRFAAKDAEDFVAALAAQKGRLYKEVDARVVRNPTRETVREGLAWLRREARPGDVAVLYLSGHGFRNRAGKYFFATAEADPANTDGSMLPYEDIRDTLSTIANSIGQQAGRVMAFVDTCHAGAVLGSGLARDASFMPNDLASPENGVVVFSSSTGGQLSYEDAAWQNSAFTKALAEGLRGRPGMPEPDAALGGMLDAFRKSGRITSKMLDTYVSERVEKLTALRQTPKLIAPFGLTNFPIADLQ